VLLLTTLLLPLLLLAVAVGGFLYGRNIFNKIDRVQVSQVLTPAVDGTNYLIVGSDTRDPAAIKAAGLNPGAFEDGGGSRSDTILLLRFFGGKAYMLSIPRDLYVPIAGTGASHKINSAYGGGPTRLIQTVQQSLGIPIQHYVEVDFVSFALLVDALHGVTIDFPYPAYDRNTGLDVKTAGPVQLDGPQALAFVRSRHYFNVVNGRPQPDATGDLGRVHRQQEFLTAVLGKLGHSKNPFTIARAASNASHGLRVDDKLGFLDAARLAIKLRGLHPLSVVLPTKLGTNRDGSVLFLVHPAADPVLASFRSGTPGPVVTTTTTTAPAR
jgi:LCP family protein required for cell wall assembly